MAHANHTTPFILQDDNGPCPLLASLQPPTFSSSSSTEIERIPDDLLQEIIHRNTDAKDILMIFLVSHRFARLAAKIHTVHISLDCFQREAVDFTANPQMVVALVQEDTITHQIDKLVRPYVHSSMFSHTCLPPLSFYLSVLRFVSKLQELEDLSIEVPSFLTDDYLPLKWGAELEDGLLSNVIALRAADCEYHIQITVKGVLRDATLILDVLVQQTYHYKNLRSFIILDPRGRRQNIVVKAPDLDFFKKGCYHSRYIRNIRQISTSVPQLGEFVFLRYIYDGDEATPQVPERDLEKMVACLFQMVPEAIFQEEDVLEYIRGHLLSEFVLPWNEFYNFD